MQLGLQLGDAAQRLGESVPPRPGRRVFRDLFGGRAGRQHLVLARAVAVHRHALAAELVGVAIDLLDVLLRRLVREVAGLGDRRVGELLEGTLHLDVPLGRDVVRRHEDALPLRRHRVEVDVSRLGDLRHQVFGVPALAPRNRHEVFVHVGHEDARLIAHKRDREERLDAGRAAGDDGNGAGRRDRREVAVAQAPHRADALARGGPGAGGVRPPNRALPLRERAALFGQLLGRDLRLLVDELHQLAAQRDARIGVVPDAQTHEQVGPPHDAEADTADALREVVDLGERVLVRVDDVIEEMRAQVHSGAQLLPVHVAVLDEQADVDRTEVAHIVREQRLLTARIRRLVTAKVRHRVVVVGAIDVEHAGLAGLPRAVHDLLEDVAGVQLPDDLASARVDQVVRLPRFKRRHEGVGDGDRDVEIRDLREVILAVDEIHDVGMVHA